MTDCASCKVLEIKVEHLEKEVERLEEEVATQKAWAKSFYNQAQRLKKELANG